jgi:hypothetical protein
MPDAVHVPKWVSLGGQQDTLGLTQSNLAVVVNIHCRYGVQGWDTSVRDRLRNALSKDGILEHHFDLGFWA